MKFKILQLTADASFRTFYRLTEKKGSKIIVFAKKEKYKNLVAYSAVNEFLKKHEFVRGLRHSVSLCAEKLELVDHRNDLSECFRKTRKTVLNFDLFVVSILYF